MAKTISKTIAGLLAGCVFSLSGASAQTFSNSFAGFGSSNDEPIQIESSELQVEDKKNLAIFTGNVVVIQGDSQLKTHQLKVYYDGQASGAAQQNISRLEAIGRVFISSKDQTATGDNASFDMKRDIMVMTGKEVVLSQGPNVVVGSKLTVNLATGKADLESSQKSGRVRVLMQPNAAKGN